MNNLLNRLNYLLQKKYYSYLLTVKQISLSSTKRYKAYLRHLLIWAGEFTFNDANKINPPFTSYVSQISYSRGNKKNISLDLETQKRIIIAAKRFFRWAKEYHHREFSRLPSNWIDELIPPKVIPTNEVHKYVTLEEIQKIASIPINPENLALKRDQAAACFLYLSGVRAGSFTSLPLESVNLQDREVYQWPKEYNVNTKDKKRETTFLLYIPDLFKLISDWNIYLRSQISRDEWKTYLWYPPIQNNWGEMKLSFNEPGKNRVQALHKRLHLLFMEANMEFKSAHKFRHGHAVFGLKHCTTMAEYQALSRNLMHKNIKITDEIYASINLQERKQLLSKLSFEFTNNSENKINLLLKNMGEKELLKVISGAAEKLTSNNFL